MGGDQDVEARGRRRRPGALGIEQRGHRQNQQVQAEAGREAPAATNAPASTAGAIEESAVEASWTITLT